MRVLYEDNHLLVVDKPTGIATMGSDSGPTVYSWAAEYLKHKYNKPGNVFVGIVSRLDTFTSGVLVLARTSKAASRLSAQFRETTPKKTYLAVLQGQLEGGEQTWVDWVRKDDAAHRMRCVADGAAGAQRAELKLNVVRSWSNRTLVRIQLLTGRKHQIRVQASSRGHAVWGDRKYEATTRLPQGIALHSHCLEITHPTRREAMQFRSDPPEAWKRLGVRDKDLA
ncbi:RluA family pseudouridine synthase [Roseimaritima ulvae]|uniref:Ribosomal large subunit pseudouridine synthase C n=1 Tax=Roseimaritima ulvae TaxID=980254 RepID=A0A5B9R4H9_9BACT|nr:RluA family pseudouridine synthase [Roseimaritima ulvae]QEG41113.1 Ribosomal large subunit pseudouridine synthase C [Roseimaritima ulvae]